MTYTDGGTRNTGVYKGGHVKKTDKAAWAYLIEWDDQKVHGSGGEYGATNNKMEQTALINALKKSCLSLVLTINIYYLFLIRSMC